MFRKHILAVAALILAVNGLALGQQATSNSQPGREIEKGFVSFAEFGGSFNSSGHVLKLGTSAGYNFSRHIGVDLGVPFYFVGGSSTSSTGTKTTFSGSGIGAPYTDVRLMFKNSALDYSSSVTVYLPAGDKDTGLSTGRTSFDWNNHFERSINRFRPFGEAGVGNTVADTTKFNRPYSSYGYNAHVQGGAMFDLTNRFSVGGSAYDILPWGTQTIYSRAVPKNSTNLSGNGNAAGNNRVFEQNSVTAGAAALGKDHGFSTWADFMPAPYVTAELGYTRSVPLELDTVSFSLRFNIGSMAKKSAGK
jgi:hypothetical protein